MATEPMRRYVQVTGALFVLILLAHMLRLAAEGLGPAHDPIFVVTTLLTLAVCVWAGWLLWGRPRGSAGGAES